MNRYALIAVSLVFSLSCFAGSLAMAADAPVVALETSEGKIVVRLNPEKAPISTENFLKYAKEGYYDGTIFHRVIPGFMIQGGGMTSGLTEKSGAHPTIKNEAANGLLNKRGTIAMARTPAVDSASSQFFINLVDNNGLNYQGPSNYGYAVFGEVIEGMDVVDKIAKVETGNAQGYQNVPKKPVTITSAKIVEAK